MKQYVKILVDRMNQKLTTREFIISQIFILIAGLIFLGTLYYILYIDGSIGSTDRSFLREGPVTKEPASLMLELTSPENDVLVFNKDLEISGKTLPGSQILITSSSNDKVIQSKSDGSFSSDFELKEGVNELKIISFDKNGDQKEIERTIFYSKEKI